MIANNLTPFEPTHPGELIKDELESNHLAIIRLNLFKQEEAE